MHLKMSKKIAQLTKVSVTSVMFDKVTVTVRDRVTEENNSVDILRDTCNTFYSCFTKTERFD